MSFSASARLHRVLQLPLMQSRTRTSARIQGSFLRRNTSASSSRDAPSVVTRASSNMTVSPKTPKGLNPDAFEERKVTKKYDVSHDTVFVRFAYKDPEAVSGLTIASCLLLKAPIGEDNEDVMRPYTPVSEPNVKGHFDLMVKVYPKGTMSKHVGELQVGDTVSVKGPIAKLPYEANMKKRIGMIAGGSGITPMIQVIDAIMNNPEDKTEVSLVYANKTPGDILLKDKFDELAKTKPNFSVHYPLSRSEPPNTEEYSKGHVNADIVSQHCPEPSDDHLILVCGPPPMMNSVSGDKNPDKSQGPLVGVLADLGYSADQVYKF